MGGGKFSSWNNNEEIKKVKKTEPDENNFMDEVDELLLEQELLSPTAVEDTLKSMTTRNKASPAKIALPG